MADYYLASIDFIEGNYSRALSIARQMLRRSGLPKDAEAEMNRIAGEAAFKLGQRQEAVTYLKKYIGSVNEPAPSALYIIGVADFDEGRYGDAIYRFTPVTERGTGALRQSAYLYMGQCLLEQGDAEAAILAFDKASKATDDSAVRDFFGKVLPDYDRDRVYTTDMRKLFNWYNQLIAAGIVEFVEKEKAEDENKDDVKE